MDLYALRGGVATVRHSIFAAGSGEKLSITVECSQTTPLLVLDMACTASDSNGATLWPMPAHSWLHRTNRPGKTFIAAKYHDIFVFDRDRDRNAAWLALERDSVGVWLKPIEPCTV